MQLVLIIVGAALGSWVADGGRTVFGVVAGALFGYLLAQLATLRKKTRALESDVAALRQQRRESSAREPATTVPSATPAPESLSAQASPTSAASAPPESARPARSVPPADTRAAGETSATRVTRFLDTALHRTRRWLTTGNVPVKVGVIISFFGVAFLLKYAVDRDLLHLPIELRLLGVSAGALVMLIIGWRQRVGNTVYALSLQGGGIGILYLTIFAAFRLYDLLPAGFAFALLVLLTAGSGALAVLQNARSLAVFGTVGGFLAPLLTSTGQGSHVALFSYYLLLNAAILGISWFRAWRVLNLLGFAFTFGVGTLWGYRYYRPEFYASTQPFLLLYFLFYQAIAILFAFRQSPRLRGLVDGTLLFGTPVIAFALQSRLVGDSEYGLAWSAAAVAAFYVLVATWLQRADRQTLRLLVESFVALAVAFATIAIPLALDARWTAAAWSLEGAALVWVGVRQRGLLARVSGTLLLVAGGVAFLEAGWNHDAGWPVFNGNLLGGLLIGTAALFAARRLGGDPAPLPGQRMAVPLVLAWGLAWWVGIGAFEIADRLDGDLFLPVTALFLAASVATLAWLAARITWRTAAAATFAYLPLVAIVGALHLAFEGHWFTGPGWVAWPAALAAHLYVLRTHGFPPGRLDLAWHAAGALVFTVGVAAEAGWRLDRPGLGDAWADSATLGVAVLIGGLLVAYRERVAWPLARRGIAYLSAAGVLQAGVLLLLLAIGIDRPGDADPLPYLPLLNPADVVTAAALLKSLHWLTRVQAAGWLAGPRQFTNGLGLWGAAAFLLTTIAVVRAMHHIAGIPWTQGSLLGSTDVQAALSIYWGLLGFGGMVAGARRGQRLLWLLGTGMMALVVAKLFLVDLGNSGTVARIVSFLGVGLLLLVVGYFAPAPPRAAVQAPGEDLQ